jgi:hypothetical protein
LKVRIKHNTVIFEQEKEWKQIRDLIKRDFGEHIFAISWRLKRELGFTVRYHKTLIPWSHEQFTYENQIHLDFFSESAQSWFVLKYIEVDN